MPCCYSPYTRNCRSITGTCLPLLNNTHLGRSGGIDRVAFSRPDRTLPDEEDGGFLLDRLQRKDAR